MTIIKDFTRGNWASSMIYMKRIAKNYDNDNHRKYWKHFRWLSEMQTTLCRPCSNIQDEACVRYSPTAKTDQNWIRPTSERKTHTDVYLISIQIQILWQRPNYNMLSWPRMNCADRSQIFSKPQSHLISHHATCKILLTTRDQTLANLGWSPYFLKFYYRHTHSSDK